MKIIVSGGGTGGHISPVLAVINELVKAEPTIEILYIGSDNGLESKIIPQAGIDYRSIASGKFRRYHRNNILNIIDPTTFVKNTKDFFGFVEGYFKAKKIIREFDPDIVFTKGGYVSLPVGLAAASLKFPLVIHESDSIMGLSNRLLARKADVACVSYPVASYKDEKLENLVYTGNPIREDIKGGDKKKAYIQFGLDQKKKTVLIIGGSQGAYIINKIIAESLGDLLKKYQLIHVSGERDYDWLEYQSKKLSKDLQQNYKLFSYLSGDLKDAFAVADLVVSRAGNNVIAELAALSKPVILIPLATSANDHQLNNARILSRMGAVILMLQDHLTSKKINRQIELLFDDPDEMKRMSEKLHSLAQEDAAEKVAKEILSLALEYRRNEEIEEE
jgi:UDP-N-acetylglucosamine--N-acetylmuramyl-(pentapeptide) pyrophosphoryl-undecaprenol N-acetylglucosamine transferase